MTHTQAKQIIKSLGMTFREFSGLMGKNVNYVTDFKRYGVPENIQIILSLSQELLAKKGNPKLIIENIIKQGKTLDIDLE